MKLSSVSSWPAPLSRPLLSNRRLYRMALLLLLLHSLPPRQQQ
jgi:hypothetical protein